MSYETGSKEGGALAHNMDESKVTTYGAEVIPSPVELGRHRGGIEMQCMLLSLFAVPYVLASSIYTAMVGGGPAAFFWGFLLVSGLEECVALSMGEIASRYPTSGGPYVWSYALAPARFKKVLSYVTGWVYAFSLWTLTLSIHYGTVVAIVGVVNVYNPEYPGVAWHKFLGCIALYIITTLITWKGNHWVPKVDVFNAGWTALGVLLITVVLLSTHKLGFRSARYVFTEYDSSFSGWGEGFTFCIGLLPAAYMMCATPMIAAMSEEVAVPALHIPRAMVYGIPTATVTSIVMILGILFTLPPVETVLAAPGYYPLPSIIQGVTGSDIAATLLMLLVVFSGIMCAIACQFISSRTTWAFSRDRALPFSSWLMKVDSQLQPANALWAQTAIQIAILCISLGSSTAFSAFINVGIISVNVSYGIPIAISMCNNRKQVSEAKYYLGRWGWISNVAALAWVAFSMVLFCMPIALPVTAASFNYASVLFAATAVLSAVWYAVRAKYTYTAPLEQ